jgi:DNA invertase Pin-like site-specific DNA recombinase
MTTKAYSYLRFSTPEQMAGDSFRRQSQLATDYCTQHGLELDTKLTFQDLGVSAFRGANAETGRLAEFLEAVRSGLIPRSSMLLVESLDRVSRQAARKALRVLEDICESGITVVTLTDGKRYTEESLTSDPMSLIMSLLIFIRANEESVMKSSRLKASWKGRRIRAEKDGSAAVATRRGPGWLKYNDETKQWDVIEDRADIVRRIFKEYVKGKGMGRIALDLNKDEVPVFGHGKKWGPAYIQRILQYPAVIGEFRTFTEEVIAGKTVRTQQPSIKGYFPAIIGQALYQEAQSVRQSHLRGRRALMNEDPHTRAPTYNIFGGLVVCSRCGGSMTLLSKGGVRRGHGSKPQAKYLVCVAARYGKCKYTAVRYSVLEEQFLKHHEQVLALAPSGNNESQQKLEQLGAAIEELQANATRLAGSYQKTRSATIQALLADTESELRQRRAEHQELLEVHEATAGALVARRVENLRVALENQPMNRVEVHAMVRGLFSGLCLNPDLGTAALAWKSGGESVFHYTVPAEAGSKAA